MHKVYLDYAAATPMRQEVLEAMLPYFIDKFYNPSALYLNAQDVAQSLATARSAVARELGCKTSEVVFVAGGTESDNLAIDGVMQSHPNANLVVSAVEHDAVLIPASKYDCRVTQVNTLGIVDIADIESKIDDNTVLVSIMYANNEIGSIQPIREIAKLITAIRDERQAKLGIDALPIYFHTDACQAPNYLPLLVSNLGVDLMTLNGGKIYGPKQSGILFIKTGVKLAPQILGGGQERGIRSGTENVASAIGFAKALTMVAEVRESEVTRLEPLRDKLIAELLLLSDKLIINGSKHRLANNIHFAIAGVDNERLMMELDERDIMVATGSACSASNDEPSHVLKAIGLSDDMARSSIRITLGQQTTESDITALLSAIRDLI
ncbi:cysteine desulfurase [Candidatus Saccharibacteria bacterium]|nr:cysteine desulfurase [Candidatus Saccharibacteria bacterium]